MMRSIILSRPSESTPRMQPPATTWLGFWLRWKSNNFAIQRRAVELAHKAHELKPQRTDFFNTIGVAHYRAGDYQDAIKWLDDSMHSSNGGNARDEFFLAMAHERLGNHSQAKEYYNQAVKWMQEYAPKDEELLRFRREAQELVSGKSAVKAEKHY